jgi:hypothetical protein
VSTDVSDMYAVHQVFRDTLAAAPTLLSDPAASEPARAALLGDFYNNVLAFLHGHHEGEDVLIFPLLRERCPSETVERVAAQHSDVADLVGQSETLLEQWSAGHDEARQQLGDVLSQLGDRMAEHLDDEERNVLPLCAEHLTPQEWGMQPGRGMQTFRGNKVWLVIGLIRARMTDAQREQMLANMPPPAVEMWTGFGKAAYDELMAQVGLPSA